MWHTRTFIHLRQSHILFNDPTKMCALYSLYWSGLEKYLYLCSREGIIKFCINQKIKHIYIALQLMLLLMSLQTHFCSLFAYKHLIYL